MLGAACASDSQRNTSIAGPKSEWILVKQSQSSCGREGRGRRMAVHDGRGQLFGCIAQRAPARRGPVRLTRLVFALRWITEAEFGPCPLESKSRQRHKYVWRTHVGQTSVAKGEADLCACPGSLVSPSTSRGCGAQRSRHCSWLPMKHPPPYVHVHVQDARLFSK